LIVKVARNGGYFSLREITNKHSIKAHPLN